MGRILKFCLFPNSFAAMKALALVVVLVGLAFCSVSTDNGVYVLDESNFDSFLTGQDTLVEFYAPWCGHCKTLAPEYEAAAKELGSKVALAKVDATENENLAGRFGIEGFPTLYWFTKGNPTPNPYGGGRTKDTIISWIERQIMTDLNTIASQAEIDSLLAARPDVPVIVQFGGETNSALLNFAKSSDSAAVYKVATENVFGGNKGFVLYRSHGSPVSSEEDFTVESLTAWVDQNGFPAVTEFSQAAIGRLQHKSLIVIAVDSYADGKKQSLIDTLTETSKERSNYGWLYSDTAVLGRGIVSAGASGTVYPTAVAVSFASGIQIAFDETLEFTPENLGKWLDGVLTGETKQFKKSEPLPENNDAGVKTLVAKNFDDYVNPSKPAFVEYYAPWCGHCKSLAPVWDELGDAFKNSNVVIGKIDATANYVDVEIRGFPTLLWHATDGSVEPYEGGRDFASLKAFVSSKLGSNKEHDEF